MRVLSSAIVQQPTSESHEQIPSFGDGGCGTKCWTNLNKNMPLQKLSVNMIRVSETCMNPGVHYQRFLEHSNTLKSVDCSTEPQ